VRVLVLVLVQVQVLVLVLVRVRLPSGFHGFAMSGASTWTTYFDLAPFPAIG
jgi:hypothetical protein